MSDFCHTFHTSMTKTQLPPWDTPELSKSRFRSTYWARTEARDTDPSPRSNGSRNGGGCERAWVTVGCDKPKAQAPHLPTEGRYGPRDMWATSPPRVITSLRFGPGLKPEYIAEPYHQAKAWCFHPKNGGVLRARGMAERGAALS